MSKGVLLIALGNEHYKKMAITLAVSIRVNDPGVKISIVTDLNTGISEGYLLDRNKFEKDLFDKIIIADEQDYTVGGAKQFIRAKLLAYQLSPYEETIFLDVDQVLIPNRKISVLFDELKEVDITFSNTGPAGSSVWVDIAEVKAKYGDKPFWNFHSELFYFKKGEVARKYFASALKVYDKANLKSAFKFAGGRMADELAFQIASMQTGIYPHKENWTPNFWYVRHPKLSSKFPYELQGFITYSIGGASIPPYIRNSYNNLAAYYYSKAGLQNPYKVKDKRSYLPERAKL